jgi:biopolymer transport protein ExbD
MTASEALLPTKKKARVEIIPLIDVVFFLLATFVLFTLSLDRIAALSVPLPRTPGPVPPPQESTVFIQTTEGGMVYWKQGESTTPDLILLMEVPARLIHYAQSVPAPRVFVRGDTKAKFGDAVRIFDEVRAAGINQVSIETITSPSGR